MSDGYGCIERIRQLEAERDHWRAEAAMWKDQLNEVLASRACDACGEPATHRTPTGAGVMWWCDDHPEGSRS